jgi:hypothetical protein
MKTYRFIKTRPEWYIDLPEFIEQGGSEGDLQMVEGADNMQQMMAKFALYISTKKLSQATNIILVQL